MRKLYLSSICLILSACGNDVDLNHASASAAFISGNIEPDSNCQMSADNVLSFGTFDIGNDACQNRYYTLNLLVDTSVDELVLFDQAQVTMKDATGATLIFKKDGNPDPELNNPFMATISGRAPKETHEGIIGVRVIPKDYAPRLAVYEQSDILVEVQLTGTTPSGQTVRSQNFQYPVSLCKGCLSRCKSSFQSEKEIAILTGDTCPDNAGANTRYCIDPDC